MSYFVPVERIDPMYVQARRAADVPALTADVRQILESRHRNGAATWSRTSPPSWTPPRRSRW